ncbi:hypothetical protein MNBD_GAMMA09-3398 [hydrothermal vent metagenome]|uniref:Copper resistance protein D domain-containing protein n=1 Tax=hydrothermal vent metagenome TaxID=652676 RepID=A0A3B0X3S1_9ZZZZ
MILSLYSLLHVVSAVIWVGGMFFAYNFLRPAAAKVLEPPLRLSLWVAVFKRFFPYVWVSIVILPVTGYLMVFSIWGGFAAAPVYIHIMNGAGILMIFIYLYVFFSPFKQLQLAVAEQRWPDGGKALAQIRLLILFNTSLGVFVVLAASGGRLLVL